ncbi:hypothetical protein FB451DRAFT_476274 [Mycena latifolia]|nr:hypothetical protein FB451DRAFT_476274 [Mycena latifolia]
MQCLPPLPNDEDEVKAGPDTAQAPLLLLHICREWRSIATSTPQLWVHLHLNLANVPRDICFSPKLEAFIEEWFSRAGSFPLSFSVRSSRASESQAASLSAALFWHAPRLQKIALQLRLEELEHVSKIFGRFPLLEKLIIGLPLAESSPTQPLDLSGYFRDAGRLTEIHVSMHLSPVMLCVPWRQLAKLTCRSLNGNEFLNLIRDAPFLIEFEGSIDYVHLNLAQVITHEHLQSLRLMRNSSSYVIRSLRLPSLQNLHLSVYDYLGDDEFLSYSSGSLRRFSTAEEVLAPPIAWFFTMSHLEAIEVWAPPHHFISAFFSTLDRTQDSSFLPHLQSVTFLGCPFKVNTSLLQALSSRSSVSHGDEIAKLHTFRMIWPSGYLGSVGESSVVAALRGLAERGMKIHIGPAKRSWV